MLVRVTINHYSYGISKAYSFTVNVETFGDLKREFLKRFGNMNNVSNRLLKQKPIVKQVTKKSTNVKDWLSEVKLKTDWSVSVVCIRE